jgi:replicative DNA helicase
LYPEGLKDKLPPYNEEAEEASLGALLLNFSTDNMDKVLSHIHPDDFYKSSNSNIFRAVLNLNDRGEGVDLLTVTEELKSQDLLEKSGGAAYIASLTSSVPSTANLEYYAKVVKDCSVRRRLINAAGHIISKAHDASEKSRIIIEDAEKRIFIISDEQQEGSLQEARDVVKLTIDSIEERYKMKGEYPGVPSGYSELDSLTSGFQDSEMIIIGARPSIGKTAFALSMAANIAVKQKIPCGFFTLEMSSISLMMRLIAQESHINSSSLRTGLLSKRDFGQLSDAAGRIYESPLVIDDTPNIPLLDLRSQARRMVQRFDVRIIFIDYIGLISPENKSTPRHEQMAEISRSLKALARELNIPIIVLSQVGRQTEGKAPSLADLRESGAIEQDADIVMFLHRERIVDRKSQENETDGIETEVIVAKQRNGPTDIVKLLFKQHYTKFVSMTSESQ